MHQHAPVVRFLDEVGQHFLRDLEVRDDSVLHRLDRNNVTRGAPQHLFCFAAHGDDFARIFVDGHDRRLVHHDAFAAGEDQRIRGAQIDRKVGRKQAEHRPQVESILIHDPQSPRGESLSAEPAGFARDLETSPRRGAQGLRGRP